MPTFEFTSPEGKIYEVEGPEGATKEQAFSILQQHQGLSEGGGANIGGTLAAGARGAVAGFIGSTPDMFYTMGRNTVQDIKQLGQIPGQIKAAFTGGKQQPPQQDQSDQAPVTHAIESVLPGKEAGARHPNVQSGGEFIGGMFSPIPAAKGASAAVSGGAKALDIGSKLMPSALKKAQDAVSGIGTPTGPATLGKKMFTDLQTRMDSLLSARSAQEKVLRAKYTAEGIPKEKDIAKEYSDFLTQKFVDHPHKDEQALIEESADNLVHDRSLHSLILEKRRLDEIASSGANEKYKGNAKALAGQLANGLDDIIKKQVPSYAGYTKKYSDMSHDINLFEDTALGKRVTNEASEYLPDVPKFDPSTLPKNFFSSPHSVEILKKLSGGNQKFVDAAASEHVATELADKSAKQARAWLVKNREWLDAVPTVKNDAEKYVSRLEAVSHTQEKLYPLLKTAAKGAAGVVGAGGAYAGLREIGLVP